MLGCRAINQLHLMKGKNHTANQIIEKLRKVKLLTAQGSTIAEAAKSIEVTEQTYYRWKKRYGTMDKQDIRRLKELEKENGRLKKLLADQILDNAILKEAIEGKY